MTMQLSTLPKSTSSFESYMAYVSSLPVLSESQEKELFLKYQENNDLNAVQNIILSHLRFVGYVARSYRGYGLPIDDLVQEGTIGLMKSIKKFSLDFKVRLSSFAIHYIKAEIQEFVIRNWRLVKATTTKAKRKLFFNLKRLKSSTDWLDHKEKAKIAKTLDVAEGDINAMEVQIAQPDILLDSTPDEIDDAVGINKDRILADQSQLIEEQLIHEDVIEKSMKKITEIVNTLDERSKDIIINRWLVDEKIPHKYFSDKYNVSQERIRQIEEKSLAKIRDKFGALKANK